MYKDPKEAFDQAIAAGRLSANKDAANYAGFYMYMGPGYDGRDAFKHSTTRKYIQ